MFKNIKVKVLPSSSDFRTNIYVFEDEGTHIVNYTLTQDNILIKTSLSTQADESEARPFLSLPRPLSDIFIKAIAEYFSKSGQKTVNENLLQGKLEATEAHLQDMREMSKGMLEFLTKKK